MLNLTIASYCGSALTIERCKVFNDKPLALIGCESRKIAPVRLHLIDFKTGSLTPAPNAQLHPQPRCYGSKCHSLDEPLIPYRLTLGHHSQPSTQHAASHIQPFSAHQLYRHAPTAGTSPSLLRSVRQSPRLPMPSVGLIASACRGMWRYHYLP
jgi:hypothetical protein